MGQVVHRFAGTSVDWVDGVVIRGRSFNGFRRWFGLLSGELAWLDRIVVRVTDA